MHPPRALSVLTALALPLSAPAQAHRLVDVGGHRLDVVVQGAGKSTIVFEAGLADSLDTWAPVLPTIAEHATTVAYSRTGFGRSEPGNDYSVPRAARELHALLAGLKLTPPYILVGRSYGAIIVRLYTSLYPTDVAGLVLVEGSSEEQVKRWGALDSTYPSAFQAYFDSLLKTLKPGPYAAEIRETMRIQAAGKVEGMTPLPDIPLAVITSMQSNDSGGTVNGTARGHDLWRAMHDEWFLRSGNALHITTTHSGHDTQHEEPDLVIEAIRFVEGRLRGP